MKYKNQAAYKYKPFLHILTVLIYFGSKKSTEMPC